MRHVDALHLAQSLTMILALVVLIAQRGVGIPRIEPLNEIVDDRLQLNEGVDDAISALADGLLKGRFGLIDERAAKIVDMAAQPGVVEARRVEALARIGGFEKFKLLQAQHTLVAALMGGAAGLTGALQAALEHDRPQAQVDDHGGHHHALKRRPPHREVDRNDPGQHQHHGVLRDERTGQILEALASIDRGRAGPARGQVERAQTYRDQRQHQGQVARRRPKVEAGGHRREVDHKDRERHLLKRPHQLAPPGRGVLHKEAGDQKDQRRLREHAQRAKVGEHPGTEHHQEQVSAYPAGVGGDRHAQRQAKRQREGKLGEQRRQQSSQRPAGERLRAKHPGRPGHQRRKEAEDQKLAGDHHAQRRACQRSPGAQLLNQGHGDRRAQPEAQHPEEERNDDLQKERLGGEDRQLLREDLRDEQHRHHGGRDHRQGDRQGDPGHQSAVLAELRQAQLRARQHADQRNDQELHHRQVVDEARGDDGEGVGFGHQAGEARAQRHTRADVAQQ